MELGHSQGARPCTVRTFAVGEETGKVWWHVAGIHLDTPRLGLETVVVMSIHLTGHVCLPG